MRGSVSGPSQIGREWLIRGGAAGRGSEDSCVECSPGVLPNKSSLYRGQHGNTTQCNHEHCDREDELINVD